ncbi:MAG: right-handed parallel beta-helix repeat-containing protein [Armatimonadota bacterium]
MSCTRGWPLLPGLVVLLASLSACGAETTCLYISGADHAGLRGDDAWSGLLAGPNAAGTDGPLATLEGARDRIRALRAAGELNGPVQVLVRGGTYRLHRSFVLEPRDSGTEDAPVTYAAYPGERPVFSGGRPVIGWQQQPGGRWRARVTVAATGTGYPRQLFVNGRRATRARIPDRGYLYLAGLIDPYWRADPRNRWGFRFRAGDLEPGWRNIEDLEIVKLHSWSVTRMRVAEIDGRQGVVRFTGIGREEPRLYDWAGARYYIDNVFEGLDRAGEWYLDRPSGTLHYLPRPGEHMPPASAVMPAVERLVEFAGDPAGGHTVHHITLRGMTFEHASWPMPEAGYLENQGQVLIPTAAIFARGAEHCTLEHVEVRHVGAHGIWFERGCRHNRFERCHVWDTGAGGIYIGMERTEPETSHNVVHNCFVHHCGEVHEGGIGVWIGRSSYNEVTRCEISDLDYTGVSVGWYWGYGDSTAHHNLVADNYIHHCGHRVLSDLGGIYVLGESPGTVLRHNLIHDIWCYPPYPYGSGIYLDEGASQVLVEGNIAYRCYSAGFWLHYGRDNLVRNNILALSQLAAVGRYRPENHVGFTFERNIVLSDHPEMLYGRWDDAGNYVMDRNLYWCTTGAAPLFAGRSLEQWQAMGNDRHSIVADPGLAGVRRGDLTLPGDSPAREIGFEPISTEGIGLYGDPAWVSLPTRFKHQPDDPPPASLARAPIRESFELPWDQAEPLAGVTIPRAAVYAEGRPDLLVITDETAAEGRWSLRLSDRADLQEAFNPHFHYSPGFSGGRARCAFGLRIDGRAHFYHEWRDAATSARVGPSLTVLGSALQVDGGELLTLPVGEWVRLEIEASLGERAGRWSLTVTLPGGEVRRFPGLPCRSPDWREARWVGFVSQAQHETVLHIDEIELEGG